MNVCEVCFLFQMIWLLGTEFRGSHSEFLRENLPTPSVPESRSRGSVHSHSCRAVVLLGHAAGGGPPGTHSLSCAGARGNPSGTCSTHNCWVPVLRMWCSYRGGPSSIPRVYPLPCSLQPPSKGKNPLLFVVCPHREDLTRGPKGGRGLFPSPTRSGDVGSRVLCSGSRAGRTAAVTPGLLKLRFLPAELSNVTVHSRFPFYLVCVCWQVHLKGHPCKRGHQASRRQWNEFSDWL